MGESGCKTATNGYLCGTLENIKQEINKLLRSCELLAECFRKTVDYSLKDTVVKRSSSNGERLQLQASNHQLKCQEQQQKQKRTQSTKGTESRRTNKRNSSARSVRKRSHSTLVDQRSKQFNEDLLQQPVGYVNLVNKWLNEAEALVKLKAEW